MQKSHFILSQKANMKRKKKYGFMSIREKKLYRKLAIIWY